MRTSNVEGSIPTVADETAENQHVLANLRDGWKALSATRGLVVLIAGITIGMMAFAPLGAIFPLMTYDHFGGDGYMASVVEAAFGVGMIAGSIPAFSFRLIRPSPYTARKHIPVNRKAKPMIPASYE